VKTKRATRKTYANETEAQKARRIGPKRKIVRWMAKSKTRRIAVLECGHKRSRGMWKRRTDRCRQCLKGKPKAVKVTKKAA
jgi:hypothetical protein